MTDNFQLIRGLLKFDDPNEFYFVQILQRTKDNTSVTGHNRLIRPYHIFSADQLDDMRAEIVQLCSVFNARAYIHLNRRDARSLALEMLVDLAGRIQQGNYAGLHRIHTTACGRHHSKQDKTWVVDVDNDKSVDLQRLTSDIARIQPEGDKVVATVPTKNGVHLITRPFNAQVFGELYPQVDLHKNNPTILYVP